MRIITDFAGGNGAFEYRGDRVVVTPKMRDSRCDWFYWAFCVLDAAGEEITFEFKDETKLGRFGAAVSTDFVNWKWSGSAREKSFTYVFGENDNKVWFANHALYPIGSFEKFAESRGLSLKKLCNSNKGRAVPYIELGGGSETVLLTARHHCCESSGSYVLEGAVEYLADNIPEGMSAIVVPYMDYDGCAEGDQGKARIPHDHNRDYYGNSLYSEVSALKKLTEDKRILYAFDFHSPYYMGGRRDYPYIVHPCDNPRIDAFGRIFESVTSEMPIPYLQKNDVRYGCEWNKKSDVPEKCSAYFSKRSENILAFTLENPYFGTEGFAVSAEYLRETGRKFAQAFMIYAERCAK